MEKGYFLRMMRSFVGDDGGRRYTDSNLEMGLRMALSELDRLHPAMIDRGTVVLDVNGAEAALGLRLGTTGRLIELRDVQRRVLQFTETERQRDRVYVMVAGLYVLKEGDLIYARYTGPHTIDGLNGDYTSVPDDLNLFVSEGAAGFAMQIRARSVTEVFGKRPEDVMNLLSEADRLIDDFRQHTAGLPKQENPLPTGPGFPI